MAGSYDRRLVSVRVRLQTLVTLLTIGVFATVWPATAQTPSGGAPPKEADTVRLQLRIFEGAEDITKEARLLVYPRGQRTGNIPLTLGPDQAFEANVAPAFYDVQIIKEQRGQVQGIRWIENVLVQRYPDEYGRHLQVLNFKSEFGALQIRPSRAETAAARGWSAVVHPPGDAAHEVAKARPIGDDLLIVLPAGRYDIKVSLADRTTSWIRDLDIPGDRTRLKTWSASSTTP